MGITSEGTKGAVSGAMPWLLLAGGIIALALWIKGKIPDPVGAVKDAVQNAADASIDAGYGVAPEDMNKPIFGACSTGFNWLINRNNCRNTGAPASSDVGILAPPTGGTPFADMVNNQPVFLNEPPAPAEHYSTVWNPAEVAALKAAHSGITDPLISSYNQVRQYDTNRYLTPHGQPADFKIGDRYLDISPYGWVVYGLSTAYLGDPPEGKYHNLYGQGGSFGGLTHELPRWT